MTKTTLICPNCKRKLEYSGELKEMKLTCKCGLTIEFKELKENDLKIEKDFTEL